MPSFQFPALSGDIRILLRYNGIGTIKFIPTADDLFRTPPHISDAKGFEIKVTERTCFLLVKIVKNTLKTKTLTKLYPFFCSILRLNCRYSYLAKTGVFCLWKLKANICY